MDIFTAIIFSVVWFTFMCLGLWGIVEHYCAKAEKRFAKKLDEMLSEIKNKTETNQFIMEKEKYERAKKLTETIEACDDLLESKEDSYYWVAIDVECGNSNSAPTHHSCIPRWLWERMLAALEYEREKLQKEFNEL